MVQPSPSLRALLCGVPLRLRKPPWPHVLRLAEALMVSAARHQTIAGCSRLLVAAPAPSHGADTRRLSPWRAADIRSPMRHVRVTDVVAYAHQRDQGTLSVSRDDSWGAKDRGTRPLEAGDYPQDHPQRSGQTRPYDTPGSVPVEGR